jgi:Xaa-Pro aminopeptidase
MEAAGIELVLATSKHNVRYLLGDYSLFFAHFDAVGVDRFLPAVGYPRGDSGRAFAIASELETWQHEVSPPWTSTVVDGCQTSAETVREAGRLIDSLGLAAATTGVEKAFFPAAALDELQRAFPEARFVEASGLLEELRTIKRPDELELLRDASERIVESMVAAVEGARPGTTTSEIAERLRSEEVSRGLDFEYCLITAGSSLNRAPSQAPWLEGGILSLDSGGNLNGYIGDLCRMAVLGEPEPLHVQLLGEVQAIQDAARSAIRAGVRGAEIYEHALGERNNCRHGKHASFVAHGIGLVTHEAPRLTDKGPIRYPASHAERPLEPGMVLSVETDLKVPGVGFVKLEDTIAVTDDGYEAYGDGARDWITVDV